MRSLYRCDDKLFSATRRASRIIVALVRPVTVNCDQKRRAFRAFGNVQIVVKADLGFECEVRRFHKIYPTISSHVRGSTDPCGISRDRIYIFSWRVLQRRRPTKRNDAFEFLQADQFPRSPVNAAEASAGTAPSMDPQKPNAPKFGERNISSARPSHRLRIRENIMDRDDPLVARCGAKHSHRASSRHMCDRRRSSAGEAGRPGLSELV